MKRILTILLLVIAINSVAQTSREVIVGTNRNIELLAYVIHLVDPENNDPDNSISQILNAHPDDAKNPSLSQALPLAGNLSYSELVSLFFLLPEMPFENDYEIPNQLMLNFGYDENKANNVKQAFYFISEFARDSNFLRIWEDLSKYRNELLETIKGYLPIDRTLDEMESFYGQQFAKYYINPSLILWSAGFGPKTDHGKTANYIFGPFGKNYDFNSGKQFYNLAIHEFGHSFVNEVVEKEGKEYFKATEKLFEPIREDMNKQGNTDWETTLIEHFVRAGEVIIAENMEKETSVELYEDYTVNRQFIYLPAIIASLKKYRIEKGLSYPESVKLTMSELVNEVK